MKENANKQYYRRYSVVVQVGDICFSDEIEFGIEGTSIYFRSSKYGKWIELCETIYFGEYCTRCSHPLHFHSSCRAHRPEREYLEKTVAIGVYYQTRYSRRNYLSDLILMLKNSIYPALILGAGIAYILDTKLSGLGANDIDVITFVPKREAEYKIDVDTGVRYNQSEILAKVVSNLCRIPIIPLVIKKLDFSLHGLSEEERWRYALEGYDVVNCDLLKKDTNVAIVDDVRTSGSTGNAIAKHLKEKCNINKVYLLVAGRAYFI